MIHAAWASGIVIVVALPASVLVKFVFRRESVSALSSPAATTRETASDRRVSSRHLILFEWVWYLFSHEMFSGVIENVPMGCFRRRAEEMV